MFLIIIALAAKLVYLPMYYKIIFAVHKHMDAKLIIIIVYV